MQSKELLKMNLESSMGMILGMINDMKDVPTTFPTELGGCHPLWILGHLTYSKGTLVQNFMLGKPNPFAEWKDLFSAGTEPLADESRYPNFEDILTKLQEARKNTNALLESLSEENLDTPSKNPPRE